MLLVLLTIGFPAWAQTKIPPPGTPAVRPPSAVCTMDIRDAEHYARKLMGEQRYSEAASYLTTELRALPQSMACFGLRLLLADAQISAAEFAGARRTLTEADLQALTRGQKKAVAARFARLERQSPPLGDQMSGTDSKDHASADSLPGDSASEQKLITNSFIDTDVRQVLTDLSNSSGVPIVWDPTIEGTISYDAKEQPLENVLKAVLMPLGFAYRFEGGTCYVGSATPKSPGFALVSGTAAVNMTNVDATEAISQLSEYFTPYVRAAKSTNAVCITAPTPILNRIKQDLHELDKPPMQILIEVLVCEFSEDALRKMGLDWALAKDASDNPAWQIGTNFTEIDDGQLGGVYHEMHQKLGKYTATLSASIQAMQSTGDAEIRANPRITTLNGRQAEISLTTDQYFVIQTGSGQYQYNTLQAVSSGIKLQILPYADDTDMLTLYVKPEVGDVVGVGAQGLPLINKRSASTSVRVKNGETFTVGGLNIKKQKNVRRGIPFLSDIPFLGYVFRYDERTVQNSEIVIFVTPHLLGR